MAAEAEGNKAKFSPRVYEVKAVDGSRLLSRAAA